MMNCLVPPDLEKFKVLHDDKKKFEKESRNYYISLEKHLHLSTVSLVAFCLHTYGECCCLCFPDILRKEISFFLVDKVPGL